MGVDTDYTFRYLRERNKYFRIDILFMYFTIPAYIYWFEARVFDQEDLVANFSLIGLCSFLMILFFMPYWSNSAMSYFHYSSASDLKHATHIFVNAYHKKQHTTHTGIVPICYIEDSDLKGHEVH